jgi:hypothetical protein
VSSRAQGVIVRRVVDLAELFILGA